MKRLSLFLILLLSFLPLACKPRPSVKWTGYKPEVMTAALQSGKPVLAYFYAAWCGSCMDLKNGTFRDARVIQSLESFERVKVDMSFSRSPNIQKLGDDYGIQGLPTMILYDAQGKERDRIIGYLPADEFLFKVNQFKSRFHISDIPKAAS